MTRAEQEAVEWFRLLRDHHRLSGEDFVRYVEWLKVSPEHDALISRLESVWELTGALDGEPEFDGYAREPLRARERVGPAAARRTPVPAALASLAVLLVVLVGALAVRTLDGARPLQTYQTATGEQRTIELEDGSTVALNTATELHVDYSGEERSVVLGRGEALFDVARDPRRPFVAYAENGAVRALGTRFNVRIDEEEVIVSLVEGEVEVTADAHDTVNTRPRKRRLKLGEQTRYTADGALGTVERVDTSRVTQWRSRKLSFSDAPLREVVEEVNRYTPVKLIVDDPALADERLSAYFYIDNVDSFLAAIEQFFGIDSHRHAGKILLSRAESREP